MTDIAIRSANSADAAQISAIYRHCVLQGTATLSIRPMPTRSTAAKPKLKSTPITSVAL